MNCNLSILNYCSSLSFMNKKSKKNFFQSNYIETKLHLSRVKSSKLVAKWNQTRKLAGFFTEILTSWLPFFFIYLRTL